MPVAGAVLNKLNPYLVWPSLIGNYHVRPLPYMLGNAPTIGQALFIAFFVMMNIVFSAVYYRIASPDAWYATRSDEVLAYVFYRTGTFAYAMAPLIFLFSSRNNILLWLTNRPHSTYLLLHRWIARVFTLQAILHSILGLRLYLVDGYYASSHNTPYWRWGIVATLFCIFILLSSVTYMRRFFYEIFLAAHLVFTVILIVGM